MRLPRRSNLRKLLTAQNALCRPQIYWLRCNISEDRNAAGEPTGLIDTAMPLHANLRRQSRLQRLLAAPKPCKNRMQALFRPGAPQSPREGSKNRASFTAQSERKCSLLRSQRQDPGKTARQSQSNATLFSTIQSALFLALTGFVFSFESTESHKDRKIIPKCTRRLARKNNMLRKAAVHQFTAGRSAGWHSSSVLSGSVVAEDKRHLRKTVVL